MNVLVGVDGTDPGYRALEESLQRARIAGDDLTVAVYAEDGGRDEIRAAVDDLLREHDASADVRELDSNAGSRLVELADHGRYDRLVISGGTRSPMGKIRLGSVTEFVLLNARTTVTLVR